MDVADASLHALTDTQAQDLIKRIRKTISARHCQERLGEFDSFVLFCKLPFPVQQHVASLLDCCTQLNLKFTCVSLWKQLQICPSAAAEPVLWRLKAVMECMTQGVTGRIFIYPTASGKHGVTVVDEAGCLKVKDEAETTFHRHPAPYTLLGQPRLQAKFLGTTLGLWGSGQPPTRVVILICQLLDEKPYSPDNCVEVLISEGGVQLIIDLRNRTVSTPSRWARYCRMDDRFCLNWANLPQACNWEVGLGTRDAHIMLYNAIRVTNKDGFDTALVHKLDDFLWNNVHLLNDD